MGLRIRWRTGAGHGGEWAEYGAEALVEGGGGAWGGMG